MLPALGVKQQNGRILEVVVALKLVDCLADNGPDDILESLRLGLFVMEKTLLNGIPLFAELSPVERDELAALVQVRHVAANEPLFWIGDPRKRPMS